MHIIVVDNDESVLALVKRAIERMGHVVTPFARRNDAILALDGDQRPDGLITDFDLDTGTCEAIVAMAIAKKIFPLVVISGDPDNKRNLPKEVHFLEKPINLTALQALFPTG